MKVYIIAILVLAAAFTNTYAREKKPFEQFARTKDSLMHIAFYDKDMGAYRRNFAELLAGYNKLNAKDKAEFKELMQYEYYDVACAYAKNGDKKNALDNLERSKYYNYEHLMSDHDMDNLRSEPRFIQFLNTAKKRKSEYQLTLQRDAKYNYSEKNTLPEFTYQSATDPNLVALKKSYNLDSIAGKGNDVSKIINLMEWVHYLIPHDGSKGNPKTKNAMGFINECRMNKGTLNCRGLGILLNEVYLAEGFRSRYVTCLPKDTTDNDCHVITMVWSTSLKKWLWMDPTFMAYVMNEEGEPLSIEEVRDRLVHDKPIILNPDANRNHATSQSKRDYLGNYMSKNLYKLECPASSEYDYETSAEGKKSTYIQLIPGTVAPKSKVSKDQHGVAVYSTNYTNNPKAFWAPPPPSTAAATTTAEIKKYPQADYEALLHKFKDCYNQKNAQCVRELFPEDSRRFWTDAEHTDIFNDYGALRSYTFLGMEPGRALNEVALFKMEFEKSTHCMGLSIKDGDKFGTFRLKTHSEYIDWLLAKSIDKDKGVH